MNKTVSIILIILIFFFYSCFYIIYEGQRGILLRLGQAVRANVTNHNDLLVYKPGLHFKIPFFEKIEMFSSKIQTIEDTENSFFTKNNQCVMVDFFIKWKINDFSRFYLTKSKNNLFCVKNILQEIFNDYLSIRIKQLNLNDTFLNSNNILSGNSKQTFNCFYSNNHGNLSVCNNTIIDSLMHIDFNKIKESKFLQLNRISECGIKIVDFNIVKIKFSNEMFNTIYNKMKIEQETQAKMYRLQGQNRADQLKLESDFLVSKQISEAIRAASIIKGEGEATVVKLFLNIFNVDPEFYNFIFSLNAYEKIFKHNSFMFIDVNNNKFFRYMK
ncbi:MAG: protease modulator HflC [Buchnera aphidicola (Chaetogeoica yunlongensis)]